MHTKNYRHDFIKDSCGDRDDHIYMGFLNNNQIGSENNNNNYYETIIYKKNNKIIILIVIIIYNLNFY